MTLRSRFVSAILLLVPVEVQVADGDSATTGGDPPRLSADFVGGGGRYALVPRDCEGQPTASPTEIPFREAAGQVQLEHDRWRLGIRSGWLSRDQPSYVPSSGSVGSILGTPAQEEAWYVNPHAALDWRYLGLGAGWFHASERLPDRDNDDTIPFSAKLRIGTRRTAAELSIMEAMPLLSGGGYGRLGIRLGFRQRDSAFFGLSTPEPFDAGGVFGTLDLSLHPRVSALVRARTGSTEGVTEGGLAVGLRWHGR